MQLDVNINLYCDECGTSLDYTEPWNSDISVKACPVCARSMWKHFAEYRPEKDGYYAVTQYYYEDNTGIAKYSEGRWIIVEQSVRCNVDTTSPTFQWTEISKLVK